MKTAARLVLYDDILDPKDVFSLIALTSYYNQFYAQTSRAFIRLESLETLAEKDREVRRQSAMHETMDRDGVLFCRRSPTLPCAFLLCNPLWTLALVRIPALTATVTLASMIGTLLLSYGRCSIVAQLARSDVAGTYLA